MDLPLAALSEAEEVLLSELLSSSDSAPLPYARGVASAVACETSLNDPAQWLPLILGANVPDEATLQQLFALLMRDRHAIAECLRLGEPYAPHPNEHAAATQFCKGLIRATRLSQAWENDLEAQALTLPLAVLAGYLELNTLRKTIPETMDDDATWRRQQRQRLKDTLAQLFEHFAPLREQQAATAKAAVTKVGRNDTCPCGSGKKYKKCCGATHAN